MVSKIRTFIIISAVLAVVACQKNNVQNQTELDAVMAGQPESISLLKEQKGLGALMQTDEEYAKFKKADVVAIRKATAKLKGEVYTAAAPASFLVEGSAIGDQGQEGSCVAWATAYATASALEHVFKGTAYPAALRSPEYVYNQIKATTSCASGAYISRGLDLIKTQGVCSWAEMPYTDVSCSTMPNATQTAAAAAHKFTTWATVGKTDVNAVKQLVSAGLPVILGITVDQSFYDMGRTSTATWTAHKGKIYGGHAVAIVGYDDAKQAFKVQNSWSTAWGQQGYFWITYTFFAKARSGAANEAYVAYVQ